MHPRVLKVRGVFDEWAQNGRAEGMEKGHGRAAAEVFAELGVAAGERYLDIGCGNGYTVRWAASVSPDVDAVGLDVSSEMIRRARALSAPQENAHFICGELPQPQVAAGSVDAAFSMEALYYFADVSAGLREVAAVLRPGGRFGCVVDYYRENEASHTWPEETGTEMTLWSAAEWRDQFAAAGFASVRQRRLTAPLERGETPSWKHSEGSLFTFGLRAG